MALTETAVNRINSTFGYKQLIPFDCLILNFYQFHVSIVSLTCRMNSSASSSEVLVLLHQVDESGDGLGLEVDIAVKSEQVRVLGFHLFK